MALFKCKMCGGDLNITADEKIIECEFCGTTQTIPTSKDENLQGLFNRANILRMKSEFDKAEQLYEKIIEKDETQAEAYWGLILCKYGIEYVEDPQTFKRIPTCHRTSFDSIIADEDYKSALAHADSVQRGIYEAEAKKIDRIQKGILELSQKEEPYDVFICYKETDNDGKRTQDSVIANDIYHQLTQEGLKVFYAAITLENKLGSAYEPCIFAALNSAKVMLAIGTKPEHFNAVWVKNEWSRFLKIIQKDRSKLLIPCYRDMDAYELPEEFAHLQAQDMSKIGFINDIVRGIKKVVTPEEPKQTVVKETVTVGANSNTAPLLERVFMFLEDGDWNSANEYCEKVLDLEPKCAEAYLGKLMAELHVKTQQDLKNCKQPFDDMNNYKKIIRFGAENLKAEMQEYIEYINERNVQEETESIYTEAKNLMDDKDSEGYEAAVELFDKIINYKDSKELKEICLEKIDECIYTEALGLMNYGDIKSYELAADFFARITDYKDSEELRVQCIENIEEQKRKAKEDLEKSLKNKKNYIAAAADHSIALKKDGTVVATKYIGNFYKGWADISSWRNIVEISSCSRHTVGLKKDGTVVATGINDDGQCNVSSWTDIAAVSTGSFHTVGLKKDGSVVAVGSNEANQCNVSSWKDIIAISSSAFSTLGLKKDGTVIATYSENNVSSWKDIASWKEIVSIAAGVDHSVGLKYDGTVIATGSNKYGQCNVSSWKDIIAISAGNYHTIGLKKDGTVVATTYIGSSGIYNGQCEVSSWKDIVAISAGWEHTIALKNNGTVVSTKYINNGMTPYHGQCDVTGWSNIMLPTDTNEVPEVTEEFVEIQSQEEQYRNAGVCQHCGGTFKGFFTKTCTKCGKKKDY